MTFTPPTYPGFVSDSTPSQSRLFPQYGGWRDDFDIIVVGSGMGGGVLADDLGDRLGAQKRILVLEAGSYLYPTHVFNLCRFPNADVARKFGCTTFWQNGNSGSENYIHELPQLNFGGRSIFWSGLIPEIQPWELDFFPDAVKNDLGHRYLDEAGVIMNESASMGATARAIRDRFRATPLNDEFVIEETPRALHQPYLARENAPPVTEFFVEPSGVFNTAELLINQTGLAPGVHHGDGNGLFLLLDRYVEDVQRRADHRFDVIARNTLTGEARSFNAGTMVLAGGSIESPKLLRRSSMYPWLPDGVKGLVGRGLTDHPTTDWIRTLATHMGNLHIRRDSHAKIVFYSERRRACAARGRTAGPRERIRLRHRPSRHRDAAHAVASAARRPLPEHLGRRREPRGGRSEESVRVRHVGHAVQLRGEPGAHAGGPGAADVTAFRVSARCEKMRADVR